MRLYNNDFKATMKGYKAVKTVCKSANYLIGNGEVIIQASNVEVSVAVDNACYEQDILLDENTLKLLEKCKSDDFEIELGEIKAGTKHITYACEDEAKELIDTSNYKEVASVSQAELLEMLKGVKFGAAKDEVRPVLTNILWRDVNFVTVDGFRITTKTCSTVSDMPILFTPTAYNLLEKLLDKKSKEPVKVFLDMDHTADRYVSFEFGDVILTCLVGEGEFMNYKQVFTNDYNLKVKANRKDLLEKIEFLQQEKSPVKIKVSKEELTLTTESVTNKLTDSLKVEFIDSNTNSDIDIAFNPKYLIESLKNGLGDEIELQFISSLTPLIINYDGGKDLLLPIRLH